MGMGSSFYSERKHLYESEMLVKPHYNESEL